MKKNLLYLALSLFTAISFIACSDDNDEPAPVPVSLNSISASISSMEVSTMAISEENPTASDFEARVQVGHTMNVDLNGKTAEYQYQQSKWVPKSTILEFPLESETGSTLKLTVGGTARNTQDGTKEGLLKADELYYENTGLSPKEDLTGVAMKHTKALVELTFTTYDPENGVLFGTQTNAYKLPGASATEWKYQAIIEPEQEKVVFALYFDGKSYEQEIFAEDFSGGHSFEANKIYRVPVQLTKEGIKLEISSMEVVNWSESSSEGEIIHAAVPNFEIAGFANQTITISYADNSTKSITFNEDGKAFYVASEPKIIRSIKNGEGEEILIGRLEGDGGVKLEFNTDGSVKERMSGESMLVNTIAELRMASSKYFDSTGEVVLESNLDMMNIEWKNSGTFKANFDGGNFEISNFVVNEPDAEYGYFGLFGNVTGGSQIKNLHIKSGSIHGLGYVGSICGYLQNGSIINCTNRATVKGETSNVGGIVGMVASGGTISGCTNHGDVSIALDASNGAYVGGITGAMDGGKIINCGNTGNVSGVTSVGGVVGRIMGSEMTACYNTGKVRGNNQTSGICYLYGASGTTTVTACYNLGDVTLENSGVTATKYVGGAFSRIQRASPGKLTVNACYNAGTVTSNSTATNVSLGGLAGAISTPSANVVIGTLYWTGADVATVSSITADIIKFASDAWPANDASKSWGVGSTGVEGLYWKTLNSWTSGGANQKYPELYWE